MPDTITDLTKLSFLELSGNRFTRFPIELSDLKSLKTLNILNNRMDLLPRAIGEMTQLETLNLSRNILKALPVEFVRVLSVPDVDSLNPWSILLPNKWGKLWLDKHARQTEPEVIMWPMLLTFCTVYGDLFDAAEEIWAEFGVFHYTNRLGFGDFLEELRRRLASKWHEGLVEHVKTVYFESRSTGIFPRWYSLEGYEDIQRENELIRQYDKERREECAAREGRCIGKR